MYKVNHYAYCGMAGVPQSFEDLQDARAYTAARIRRYRAKGFAIAVLARGSEWEILEPEDALLVPDDCGTLELEHITYDCDECGSAHETLEDARACCTYDPYFPEDDDDYDPYYPDDDD